MNFKEQEVEEPLFEALIRAQLIDSLESRAVSLPESVLPEEEMIEAFNYGLRVALVLGRSQLARGEKEVKSFTCLPDLNKSLFVDYHQREGNLRFWLIEGVGLLRTNALGFKAKREGIALKKFDLRAGLSYKAELNLSQASLNLLIDQLGVVDAYLRRRENRSRVFVFGMV